MVSLADAFGKSIAQNLTFTTVLHEPFCLRRVICINIVCNNHFAKHGFRVKTIDNHDSLVQNRRERQKERDRVARWRFLGLVKTR